MEIKITTDNFKVNVLESELPVLIDFYADWCGPCKMMGPIVKNLADKYDGKMKIGKCNIDEEMDIAQKYSVMSIPTFIFYKNGEAIETIVGAMSERELESKIGEVLAR